MKRIIGLFGLLVFWTSCSKTTNTSPLPILTQKHTTLINASNDFGFDLYKNTIKFESSDKNVITSPLSVSMALSMLLNGTHGQSTSDLMKTLRLDVTKEENNKVCLDLLDYLPKTDPKVTINISNSIWARADFKLLDSFVTSLKNYFNSEITSLDFLDKTKTKNTINAWVDKSTNGKIKTIVDDISDDHVLFIINAVYFNAPWTKEFEAKNTKKTNFNLMDGSTKSVDMMYSNELKFKYFRNDDVEIIELPYGSGQYAMTAIMPNEVSKFSAVEATLSNQKFNEWKGKLTSVSKYDLYFPKFELDYEIDLKNALSSMGMASLFSSSADLSGISQMGQLEVSEVKHKTYMKVNEQGTEAAAATSVGVVVTSMPPTINFNKPFFLFITEKNTNAILFSGRIMKP
jgi:serpin B